MGILAAIGAAVLPTVVYTLIIWWLDRYEKEPLPLLAVAFLWGSLPAVALALVVELLLQIPVEQTFLGPGVARWALAPLVEEPAKALAVAALFFLARAEFDGLLDGIVYGALVGFGFSMSENLLYFLFGDATLAQTFWLRGVLFGCNHAFFTGIVGLALGGARYLASRAAQLTALAAGLLLAIVFHALHNVAISYALAGLLAAWLVNAGGVATVLLVALLAWRHERGWMLRHLPAEVVRGVIDQRDYEEAVSAGRRARGSAAALVGRGWRAGIQTRRLHQLITELAFCKHQLSIGDPSASHEKCEQLRGEIIVLRRALAAPLHVY